MAFTLRPPGKTDPAPVNPAGPSVPVEQVPLSSVVSGRHEPSFEPVQEPVSANDIQSSAGYVASGADHRFALDTSAGYVSEDVATLEKAIGDTRSPVAIEVEHRAKAHKAVETIAPELNFWELVGDKPPVAPVPHAEHQEHPAPTQSDVGERVLSTGGNRYRFLGELLMDAGIVSQEQVDEALVEQLTSFETIGEILKRKGLVTDEQIKEQLTIQNRLRTLENILRMLNMKVNHVRSSLMRIEGRGEPIQQVMRDTGYLSEERVAIAIAALHSRQFFSSTRVDMCNFAEIIEKGATLEKFQGFIPVAILPNGELWIAIEDTDKINDAHNHFQNFAKKNYVIAASSTLHKIYCTFFSRTEETLLQKIKEAEGLIANGDETNNGFIRRLIGHLLRHGCYSGASDIHLKESPYVATISMRYDGILKDIAYCSVQLHNRLIQMLRTDGLANDNTGSDEIAAMREGKVKMDADRPIQAEFQDVLDRYGFRLELGIMVRERRTAVIRIIDKEGATSDLNNLNFDAETRAIIDECIHSSDGMILLVGPTGSGKTTTLYAAMSEIDAEQLSIQTTENPVEGEFGKWMQFEVTGRSGKGEGVEMALYFRGMMRNDPDVILVGEIRDDKVADTAVQAAKTGHLVFSTIHVTRAALVVTRLLGLKVERQDIADTLKLVIAQRLVRKLCRNCSIPDTRESTQRRFKNALESYLADIKEPRFMCAQDGGCKECRYTGYRGRMMVYETLRTNDSIRQMIESGASTSKIQEAAIPQGKSMYERGMRYVANGFTSIEELLRNIDPTEGA